MGSWTVSTPQLQIPWPGFRTQMLECRMGWVWDWVVLQPTLWLLGAELRRLFPQWMGKSSSLFWSYINFVFPAIKCDRGFNINVYDTTCICEYACIHIRWWGDIWKLAYLSRFLMVPITCTCTTTVMMSCVYGGCPLCRRWLMEEAQKLERQQKLQQQKLFELQQVGRVLALALPSLCIILHELYIA